MSAPKRKRDVQLNFRVSPEELVSLMRYSSNNLNQRTHRVHEIGRIYDADLEDISRRQEALWDGMHQVLTQLAKLS
ncbi:MAG TPA: hypothetical protein H9700_13180 [Candidatus Eisenbergiella intestinipullorum]|nr:hypothetical protein [Candidatus Eisenbergiella intestinipullorum]